MSAQAAENAASFRGGLEEHDHSELLLPAWNVVLDPEIHSLSDPLGKLVLRTTFLPVDQADIPVKIKRGIAVDVPEIAMHGLEQVAIEIRATKFSETSPWAEVPDDLRPDSRVAAVSQFIDDNGVALIKNGRLTYRHGTRGDTELRRAYQLHTYYGWELAIAGDELTHHDSRIVAISMARHHKYLSKFPYGVSRRQLDLDLRRAGFQPTTDAELTEVALIHARTRPFDHMHDRISKTETNPARVLNEVENELAQLQGIVDSHSDVGADRMPEEFRHVLTSIKRNTISSLNEMIHDSVAGPPVIEMLQHTAAQFTTDEVPMVADRP